MTDGSQKGSSIDYLQNTAVNSCGFVIVKLKSYKIHFWSYRVVAFFVHFPLMCAFRFQALLFAVRSTCWTSEHVCLALLSCQRGQIFIFNLTAVQLFLDVFVQTVWPSVLFRYFNRIKRKEERKELTWLCLYRFSLHTTTRSNDG